MTSPPSAADAPNYDVRRVAIGESIRDGLWFIPVVVVAGAVVLASITDHLDHAAQPAPGMFRADASSAQALLSTIAASTLAMTTLVLSITIVALQLASQQFSPRVMRAFLRDTGPKVALGIFLATTVHALLVLRTVVPKAAGQAEFVPRIGVSMSFAFILCSLAAFVYYLHHVAHSIRAVSIMESVAAEARAAIRALDLNSHLDHDAWPDREPDVVLTSERPPGTLVGVDPDDLVRLASTKGVRLRVLVKVGDYLPSGSPAVAVWTDTPGQLAITSADVAPYIGLGHERTMSQDPAFGFRQLVDMAEKALSPAINDPTTAVQSIDRIHDLLRRLAMRPDAATDFHDEQGTSRLAVPAMVWSDYLDLAFDEIRHYGGASLQVQRRLRSAITDLEATVIDDPVRVDALVTHRRLLDRAAVTSFPDLEERLRTGWAASPDAETIQPV